MRGLGCTRNASRMTIERDWQAGTVRVAIEIIPEPVTIDEAGHLIRACSDFELREVSGVRDRDEPDPS